MVRYKIHYKKPTPRLDTLRLVLVPVIAAVLAVGSCEASRLEGETSTWNSPRTTPVEAPIIPQPALRAEIKVTASPVTGSSSAPTGAPKTRTATAPTPPKHELQPTAVSRTTSPRTGQPISTGSKVSERSDQQEQQNFSARTDPVPESIQSVELTPCQRSAADCFSSGGLDTLMDNLDGLTINPDTGRFCFSFQEGCERR